LHSAPPPHRHESASLAVQTPLSQAAMAVEDDTGVAPHYGEAEEAGTEAVVASRKAARERKAASKQMDEDEDMGEIANGCNSERVSDKTAMALPAEGKSTEAEVDAPEDESPRVSGRVDFYPEATTVNVMPVAGGKLLMTLSEGGFQYLLAGARGNMGLTGGRYMFEVVIVQKASASGSAGLQQQQQQQQQQRQRPAQEQLPQQQRQQQPRQQRRRSNSSDWAEGANAPAVSEEPAAAAAAADTPIEVAATSKSGRRRPQKKSSAKDGAAKEALQNHGSAVGQKPAKSGRNSRGAYVGAERMSREGRPHH